MGSNTIPVMINAFDTILFVGQNDHYQVEIG